MFLGFNGNFKPVLISSCWNIVNITEIWKPFETSKIYEEIDLRVYNFTNFIIDEN